MGPVVPPDFDEAATEIMNALNEQLPKEGFPTELHLSTVMFGTQTQKFVQVVQLKFTLNRLFRLF